MSRLNFTSKIIISLLILYRRRRLRQRQWWVHPIISSRQSEGKFYLLHEKLKMFPKKFFEFYRMSQSSFNYLLTAVNRNLQKRDTHMRDSVKVEEKLSVTLR